MNHRTSQLCSSAVAVGKQPQTVCNPICMAAFKWNFVPNSGGRVDLHLDCRLPVPGPGNGSVTFPSFSLKPNTKYKFQSLSEHLSLEGEKCERMGLFNTESLASFGAPTEWEVMDRWEIDGPVDGPMHRWTERSAVDYMFLNNTIIITVNIHYTLNCLPDYSGCFTCVLSLKLCNYSVIAHQV